MKHTVLQVHLLGIRELIDPIQDHIQGGKSVKFANLHGFHLLEDFCNFSHAEFAVSLILWVWEFLKIRESLWGIHDGLIIEPEAPDLVKCLLVHWRVSDGTIIQS